MDISREHELGNRNQGSDRRRGGERRGYWRHWFGTRKKFSRVQPKGLADKA